MGGSWRKRLLEVVVPVVIAAVVTSTRPLESAPVFYWDAKRFGNNLRRQPAYDVVREAAFALLDHVIGDLPCQVCDVSVQPRG